MSYLLSVAIWLLNVGMFDFQHFANPRGEYALREKSRQMAAELRQLERESVESLRRNAEMRKLFEDFKEQMKQAEKKRANPPK